jgi:hypothetical protein
MADPTAHPDLAELEASRTGEATPEIEAHVAACAECRRAIADLGDVAVALRSAVPTIPDELNDRILWIARKEAAGIRRRRRWGAVASWRGAAVAAGALLALGVLRAVVPLERARTAPTADVDGNGVVDIRDAFLIARAVRAGIEPPARLDVNGDHVVDGGDVDLVAHAAVSLARSS